MLRVSVKTTEVPNAASKIASVTSADMYHEKQRFCGGFEGDAIAADLPLRITAF